MIQIAFQPWRRAGTWWGLAHILLGIVVGTVTFVPTITLLSLAAGLIVLFPAAIVVAFVLFLLSEGLGILERSRVRALLATDIPAPHPPLLPGSWWSKLKQRARTGSRWREIAHHLVLFPMATVSFAVALAAWCGSAALLALPLYVNALPGHAAKFGLFAVTQGVGSAVAALVGLIGLALIAPWTTVGIAAVQRSVALRLLGPSPGGELKRRLRQVEASRAAAVDSAEAERRRIERDLHDGAPAAPGVAGH